MSDELDTRATLYREIAQESLGQLLNEFTGAPSLFFSESDVKCRLFYILFQNDRINTPRRTSDGQYTWPLHTEVSYFNDDSKLLFHVDLSIVDPSFTDTFSNVETGGVRLSKGYSAKMCYAAIELKLNKLDNKNDMMKNWISDMDKLTDIRTRNPYLACFSVLFDKKANTLSKNEFDEVCKKYKQVRVLYANTKGQVYLNF